MVHEGDLLWTPAAATIEAANLTAFMRWLREHRGLVFTDYADLWRWSVADIAAFWECLWEYYDVESSTPHTCVLAASRMPGACWFPGARVNFARQVLRAARPGALAIHAESELRPPQDLGFDELGEQVRRFATRLRRLGIAPGDRVVAYMPAIPETAIALLAAASIGAVWSCCSPDFGTGSVLDRYTQIEPTLLIAVDGYRYGGRDFDRRAEVARLLDAMPSVRHVVTVPYLDAATPFSPRPGTLDWSAIQREEPAVAAADFRFEDTAFDHPLWIVYSSGTTGLPKSFVHGHGGIVLELYKFCGLHLDLKPESRTFLFSTTGWVTWNILVGALMTGSSIVFYDGNPTAPDPQALWRIAARSRASFMGTSPAFVSLMMQQQVVPRRDHDLSALRGMYCTGSPVSPEHFAWFYANVRDDLWVSSTSGGTDVASGFVGGCPLLPVRAGEIQTRLLGVDVQAWDEHGEEVVDRLGELVVRQPMPSMPLYLWNDPDGTRYRESYFDVYPGVWRHGDYLMINGRGGCFVRGRSDSTLNRYGVRIGTAEIYRPLETLPEVEDGLIVNLDLPGGRFFMPLFVKLAPGCTLDARLLEKINSTLRAYSPRHVPDRVYAVPAIPYTRTGKKMEVPVRKLLLGAAAEAVASADAMADATALDWFVAFAREHRDY
ncbi:MAG: acetoacetate--CoA ligase [Gammaproteobacteria bacterium]